MSKTDEPVFNVTKVDASGTEEVVIVAGKSHPTGNCCTV